MDLYRDGYFYYSVTHRSPNAPGTYLKSSLMDMMAWDATDHADLIDQPLLDRIARQLIQRDGSFVTYQVRIAAAVCTFLMECLVVSWELLIFAGSYTIKSRI